MQYWQWTSGAAALLCACGGRSLDMPVEGEAGTGGCIGPCAGAAGTGGASKGGGSGGRPAGSAGTQSGMGGIGGGGGAPGSGGRGGTGGSFTGTRSVTLETDTFVVGPGQEMFRCQHFGNPFGTDVDVLRTESIMPPGSHHLGVFFESGVSDGALYECSGLQFTAPLHQSQKPHIIREYPEGIGMRMEAPEGLRFVMHYLNTTAEPITAKVELNITAAAAGSVEQQAGIVFMNTMGISVPPRSKGTATGHCTLPSNINLLELNSHMHMHATHIVANTGSGLLLYEGDDWNDPVPRYFSPPLALGNDTNVSWTCSYDNTSDQPLSFGESAATNEMCIIAGTFYPALEGRTHACLF